MEPRLGRGGRPADRHDRAAARRTDRKLAFRQEDPASATRPDVDSAAGGRARRRGGPRAPMPVTLGREPTTRCRPRAACRRRRLRAADRRRHRLRRLRARRRQPRDICIAHLADIADPLTRGARLVTLWEEMLDGRVAAARLSSDARRARCRARRDELNVQRMLVLRAAGVTGSSFRRRRRDALAPRLEAAAARRARRGARTPSLKSAWFSALRDTARTRGDAGVARAGVAEDRDGARPDARRAGLHHAGAGAGGPRAVPAWQEILDEQLARIENPDRKARFAFVRPALSRRSGASRDTFFDSLARRPEPPPRGVGARGGRLPPSPAARGRRRASTSPRASRCCARSSAPATSSFRSDGWTRRSAGTAPRAPRGW